MRLLGVCLVFLVPLRAAASENTLLEYAGCIGGGDQYAANAAEFGYNQDAHKRNSEHMMEQLASAAGAPNRDVLDFRWVLGKQQYRELSIALQGKQSGLARDEFKAFHTKCDSLRAILVKKQILKD